MTIQTQCLTCKHFKNDNSWSCSAYNDIPGRIVFNKVIHSEVQPDQEGAFVYTGEMPLEEPSVYRYFDIS